LPKDASDPTKYIPQMDGYNAANWFDDDTQLLYVVIKGSDPIELKVQPVIQVGVL